MTPFFEIRKFKGSKIAKTVLKQNKVGGLTLQEFKTYNKATVIKMVGYWHKDRNIDEWKREHRNKLSHI